MAVSLGLRLCVFLNWGQFILRLVFYASSANSRSESSYVCWSSVWPSVHPSVVCPFIC